MNIDQLSTTAEIFKEKSLTRMRFILDFHHWKSKTKKQKKEGVYISLYILHWVHALHCAESKFAFWCLREFET
jgi:hypothetical protein